MTLLEIISIAVTAASAICFSTIFAIVMRAYVRSAAKQIQSGERDGEIAAKANASETPEGIRKKKIVHWVKTVLFALFLILIIPLLIFSIVNRFANGKPVLGKTFMVVASGSMSKKNPDNDYLFQNDLGRQFDKYDIIVLNSVSSPEELGRYDIIAYRNDEGKNIIHRIVNILDENGSSRFVMRGDANNANDIYRPRFEDVIGVYKGVRVRFLGMFVMFLQSYPGLVTVIALLYCMFAADSALRKIRICESEREALLANGPPPDGEERPSADGEERPSADGEERPSADGEERPSADGEERPSAVDGERANDEECMHPSDEEWTDKTVRFDVPPSDNTEKAKIKKNKS